MFEKEIKYSKRFQEIVKVFIKNGLSHLLFRIGIKNKKIVRTKTMKLIII